MAALTLVIVSTRSVPHRAAHRCRTEERRSNDPVLRGLESNWLALDGGRRWNPLRRAGQAFGGALLNHRLVARGFESPSIRQIARRILQGERARVTVRSCARQFKSLAGEALDHSTQGLVGGAAPH